MRVTISVDRVLDLIGAVSLVVRQLNALLIGGLIGGSDARLARKLGAKTPSSTRSSRLLEGVRVATAFLAMIDHLKEARRSDEYLTQLKCI